MLLLRGATVSVVSAAAGAGFNTCSSCEEQQEKRPYYSTIKVSIHAPLARSNAVPVKLEASVTVSIHAPLARSNNIRARAAVKPLVSIHAPLARSNRLPMRLPYKVVTFQYMLLLRGATYQERNEGANHQVSIHAPLARSNYSVDGTSGWHAVSIHAPLARSNMAKLLLSTSKTFQYMLLLRGAT